MGAESNTVWLATEVIDVWPSSDNVEIRIHYHDRWPTANVHWVGGAADNPPSAHIATLWTHDLP